MLKTGKSYHGFGYIWGKELYCITPLSTIFQLYRGG